MFSSFSFSTFPWSSIEGSDLSVLPPFADLLANPDAERFLILDGEAWDPVGAEVVPIGYSSGVDFDLRTFGPWLVDAVNYETRLFDNIGRLRLAGSPTTGDISIAIGDGENDQLCGYRLDGRLMRVKMGGVGFTFGQFETVFEGTAQHATWGLQRFSIALRDPSAKVEKPIQANRYAGTGTLEGGDDLKGKVKPLWFGACWNVPGVLVDRTNLVFQLHDGSMDSIDALFDKAESWPIDSDVADETALYAWTPVAGHAVTCNAIGCARLGSVPLGLVTADGTGDDTGGYIDTAAEIARRILQTQGGLPDSALDVASFADLATDQPARVGVWVDSDIALTTVVDAVLGSIFGWRTFTREGLIAVGRLEFGTPERTIGAADVADVYDIAAIGTEAPELPFWRRSLGYRRSFAVQGPDDVAITATDARKDFVSQEFRRATWDDAGVLVEHPLAEDLELDTLLVDETDAQDEADRQGTLLGVYRDRYVVAVKGVQFLLRPGETVTLEHPRFGLSTGRDFIIVALAENTSIRRTTLWLWG